MGIIFFWLHVFASSVCLELVVFLSFCGSFPPYLSVFSCNFCCLSLLMPCEIPPTHRNPSTCLAAALTAHITESSRIHCWDFVVPTTCGYERGLILSVCSGNPVLWRRKESRLGHFSLENDVHQWRRMNNEVGNEETWGGQGRCDEVKLGETAAKAERHKAQGCWLYEFPQRLAPLRWSQL